MSETAQTVAVSPRSAKGRVLRATFGCNPNSSSLGVDVTFLLFGATAVGIFAIGLGALLRRSRPSAPSSSHSTATPTATKPPTP